MLFIFITLFGILFTAVAFFHKGNPNRSQAVFIGIVITGLGAMTTYWWNPDDMFTTTASKEKRAVYNVCFNKGFDVLRGEIRRNIFVGSALMNQCRSESKYYGEEKSLFAPFTR